MSNCDYFVFVVFLISCICICICICIYKQEIDFSGEFGERAITGHHKPRTAIAIIFTVSV